MILRRLAPLAMVVLLAAPSAFAQSDDDFLVPLTDSKPSKSKKPAKAAKTPKTPKTPKEPKKRTATKTPKKPAKKATAKRGSKAQPVQETPAPEDDALAVVPLVESKTELLVKLGSAVRGARLFIDNQDMGPLPVPVQEIAPGEHTVAVRRPGYSEFSRRITVEAGRVNEVVATMEAVAGVVAVNTDVPGTSVVIDGEPKGVAPLKGVLLKPGSHTIEARRDGFEAEPKTIGVRAGRDYSVDFHMRPTAGGPKTPVASVDRPAAPVLTPKVQPKAQEPDSAAVALGPDMETQDEVEPSKPLTSRWYFWAGVGAVVAGGVVGAVAMTQDSPAKPLTLEDVCGVGGCDGQINAPTGAGIVRF